MELLGDWLLENVPAVNAECEFEILAGTLSARRLFNLSMLYKGQCRLKF